MELVILLVFATIVTLGLALGNLGQRPEQRRLARLATGEKSADSDPHGGLLTNDQRSWLDRLMQPFAGDTSSRREETLAPIRRRLTYAGFRRESAVITYMGSRVLFALALPVVVLLTPASWSLQQIQLITALVAGDISLVLADRPPAAAAQSTPAPPSERTRRVASFVLSPGFQWLRQRFGVRLP